MRAQLSRLRAEIFRCRCLPRFFGRLSGQPQGSGARPPSHRAALGRDPYFKGLRAGGLGSLIWQPPTPLLAPPDAPRPARSPTSPCQGGTERVGRVATSETETHVVTPMRAHVARPELDGPEAA